MIKRIGTVGAVMALIALAGCGTSAPSASSSASQATATASSPAPPSSAVVITERSVKGTVSFSVSVAPHAGTSVAPATLHSLQSEIQSVNSLLQQLNQP
ncbi:MAG: hypothetical protein M0Z53_10635 [Thermaerobacter sp.]|nr:hypothetical protein [Thermaerobacter sp.]